REGGAHSAGNSIIELVLDVPRGGGVSGRAGVSGPWEGRAPARPRYCRELHHRASARRSQGGRRFRAGRRLGTLFRGGRAPARPAISPQAQVLGSTTVRVPEAISAQVRDCLSHSAHQIPSPPHSQLTSETLTRLIA